MRIRQLAVLLALGSLAACQASDASGTATPPPLLTVLPRSLTTPEQLLINADNQLGFELLRQATKAAPDSNILLSPLSAGMALGMTLNGAAGTTLDSMRLALQLGSASVADINAGYHSLLGLLAGLDATSTFTVANSIWAQSGFPFLSAFLDTTRTDFDAEVQSRDLQAPASLSAINGWVNGKTNGAIPTILNRIDLGAVMILINAIYFKGAWRHGFDPTQTQAAPFHASDGSTESVPTMVFNGPVELAATPDAELIELPYGNGAFAMTILLPLPGHSIGDLVTSIDAASFAAWVPQIHATDLVLTLPKFQFAYQHELKNDLSALGMRRAFDDSLADFSRMAAVVPQTPLYLTGVTQKTFVNVDEVGTVAAAVTAVGVARAESKETVIAVNQPFLFVLRERLSGTIFFAGEVNRIP